MLWQTLIPVTLALLLAIGFGTALGGILLAMVNRPVQADPRSVAAISALGLTLVAAVTTLSLPALWRLCGQTGSEPNSPQATHRTTPRHHPGRFGDHLDSFLRNLPKATPTPSSHIEGLTVAPILAGQTEETRWSPGAMPA